MRTYELRPIADFHQFTVEDSGSNPALAASPEFWDERAQREGFASARDMVAIGTARSGYVTVTLSVREDEPADTLETWDHVMAGAIDVPSGRLRVRGGAEVLDQAEVYDVAPGVYRLLAYYGNMVVDDANAAEGDDHYKVVLWPGQWREPQVVKRFGEDGS